MNEITIGIDSYIKNLIRNLEMMWTVTLNNGVVVYSDYYRYDLDPWTRLRNYCNQNNLYPVKVKSLMFGAPEITMLEDPNGLNPFFIKRGTVKDLEIDTYSNSISYKKLIVGVYNDPTNKIDVRKFCWPENHLEPSIETRLLTVENIESMFFKNDEEQNRKKSLLLSIDGGIL